MTSSDGVNMFPLAQFDLIANDEAARLCEEWGHVLGGCHRPFHVESFALWMDNKPVAVAVSASTVNATCGGFPRMEVVELARLCAAPGNADMTRVTLRLWRRLAPVIWARTQWHVRAAVSYANKALGHTGQVYRFDGWRKVADVPGGTAGGGWSRGKRYDPKSVWVYEYEEEPCSGTNPSTKAAR